MSAGVSSGKRGTLTWGPTVDFWAMSIAISKNLHNLKGYLGYKDISQALANQLSSTKSDTNVNDFDTRDLVADPKLVSTAIKIAAATKIDPAITLDKYKSDYITTMAEDVGYTDFYAMAFKIFGYSNLSTFKFYLLFMSLSIILFIVRYKNNLMSIYLLSSLFTAIFLTSNSSVLSESVASIASNRFLTTLGLIPLIHIILEIYENKKVRLNRDLIIFGLQSFLLIQVILFRSSAQWMVCCIVGFTIINYFILRAKHKKSTTASEQKVTDKKSYKIIPNSVEWIKNLSLILICLTILFVGKAFQQYKTDEIYFTESLLPHHLVWHSAFMGLSIHPDWNNNLPDERLRGRNGDGIPFTMTELILGARNIPYTGGIAGGNYKTRLHDSVIKTEFFKYILSHKKYVFELYFSVKPLATVGWLLVLFKSLPVWSWLIFLVSICAGFYVFRFGGPQDSRSRWLLFAVLMALYILGVSWLPLIWAYPAAHVMADQFSVLIFILLLLPCLIGMYFKGKRPVSTV